MNLSISDVISQYTKKLNNLPNAHQEILALISYALAKSPEWVLTHKNERVLKSKNLRLRNIFNERIKGLPIQYIIGETNFYGYQIFLNRHVLIPRPETEQLIEIILNDIKSINLHPKSINIIDVGTGSGCILVSLLSELRNISIPFSAIGVDTSLSALKVAKKNINNYHLQKFVKLINGDLLTPINKQADVIIANLPYLGVDEMSEPSIKYEPKNALVAGKNGLKYINKLIAQLPNRLSLQGLAYLEIGYDQGLAIEKICSKYPLSFKILQDLSNRDRFVRIKREKLL